MHSIIVTLDFIVLLYIFVDASARPKWPGQSLLYKCASAFLLYSPAFKLSI